MPDIAKELRERITADKREDMKYQKQRLELDSEAGARRSRLAASQRNLAALERVNATLQRLRKDIEPDLEGSRKLLKETSAQAEKSPQAFSDAERRLEHAREKSKEHEDRVILAEKMKAEQEEELAKKREQVSEIARQVVGFERALDDLPRRAQEIRQRVQGLRQSLDTSLRSKTHARTVLLSRSLDTALDELTNSVKPDLSEELWSKIAKASVHLDDERTEMRKLEAQLQDTNAELDKARSALRMAEPGGHNSAREGKSA